MVVKYSTLQNLEAPKFTLCNPGSVYDNGLLSNVVGIIIDHEAEEIVFNFNSSSELNMRINKITREDKSENDYAFRLYNSIQNRRLVFVDDIGYFMITDINDGYENGMHHKDVTAQSIDAEIAQKMVPYIADGTYRFLSDETGTNKGVLNAIVETLPLWTIGEVDESVAKKWRTFEDIDTSLNCLSFLLENVQDAYECIILFDCIHRVINVYSQDNYVRQTDIHITKQDLIDSLNITENADDLYTAISVLGDENITIASVNPTGTNVIYNFDYYLSWMSENLSKKVSEWQDLVKSKESEYYDANMNYFTYMEKISNLQMDNDKLSNQITMYGRCRDNIVADSGMGSVESYNDVIIKNGGVPIPIKSEVKDTLAEINNLIATCESNQQSNDEQIESLKTEMNEYKTKVAQINEQVSFSGYFSEQEMSELCHYIFEGSYTDEYVTITDTMGYEEKFNQMKVLYDRANGRLERVSKPTQEFSVDVENFIFLKEFAKWSEQLETGCLINVELDTNDIALLFLSNMTINYDDRSLSMTFGNRFNKFDPKSLFNDMMGNISKSANTLNYVKDIIYPIKNGEFNSMREALRNSRNLTMGSALSSSGEEVIIDDSGYTGKKMLESGEYDPRQIKITGRNIVLTDDAWESCKIAIGDIIINEMSEELGSIYGINAQALIGDMILGNELRIVDKDGNELFSVVGEKISSSIRDVVNGDEEGKTSDGSDSIMSSLSKVTQTANKVDIAISQICTKTDDDKYSVNEVTTTTGYTFNSDGLTIYKANEEIKNKLDNTGMYVKRIEGEYEEDVLTANNDGVNAINLTARQYLTVGDNSRFEDYAESGTTKDRTGCFYVG